MTDRKKTPAPPHKAAAFTCIGHPKEAEILGLFLQNTGFQVFRTPISYAGYLRLRQYKPSFVILEVPQQYMDELNFIRLVRKNDQTKNTPIIAYGNHGDEFVVQNIRQTGANSYYKRPLQTSKLMQDVQYLTQQAGIQLPKLGQKQVSDCNADIDKLLDPTTAKHEKVQIMKQHIGKLLAFPFTVAKVLQITQSSETGAKDLAKAIESDPIVTSTILKVSNTVLFASRDRRISDLKEAIIRLGFQETKNITMSLSVLKLFTNEEKSIGFDRVEFWFHSLATAVIAEKLAKNAGFAQPEVAFLSGLLSDFGVILLDEFFQELFATIMEQVTSKGTSFLDEEVGILGFDHNDVVEQLFEEWKMPQSVAYAVSRHHRFDLLDDEKTDVHQKTLAQAVGMANIIAKSMRFGRECDLCIRPIESLYFNIMHYPAGLRETFFEEVVAQLNMYNQFLKIDNRTYQASGGGEKVREPLTVNIVDGHNRLFDPIGSYLNSQGITVTRESQPKKIEEQELKPDLIFVYAGKEDNREYIHTYTGLLRRESDASSAEIKNIPLIVFHVPNQAFDELETSETLAKLPSHIDLRVVDYAIECLTHGRPVNLSALGESSAAPEAPVSAVSASADNVKVGIRNAENGVLIMDLEGSIRLSQIAELKKHLTDALNQDQNKLVLNFQKLDNMDSMLIGLLANVQKRMLKKSGELFFFGMNDEVMDSFKTTRITEVVKTFSNEQELMKHFTSNVPEKKKPPS